MHAQVRLGCCSLRCRRGRQLVASRCRRLAQRRRRRRQWMRWRCSWPICRACPATVRLAALAQCLVRIHMQASRGKTCCGSTSQIGIRVVRAVLSAVCSRGSSACSSPHALQAQALYPVPAYVKTGMSNWWNKVMMLCHVLVQAHPCSCRPAVRIWMPHRGQLNRTVTPPHLCPCLPTLPGCCQARCPWRASSDHYPWTVP